MITTAGFVTLAMIGEPFRRLPAQDGLLCQWRVEAREERFEMTVKLGSLLEAVGGEDLVPSSTRRFSRQRA